MLPSWSTPEATARYAARFDGNNFYRAAQGRNVSSVGIGTYLGGMDDDSDRAYEAAISAALRGGINFIDTSLNYRHQRSERNIGAAINAVTAAGELHRDDLMVCTKAGYLVPGAVPEKLDPGDVVGGMHSLSPDFLADQLARSCTNLGLEAIDVFYLHNPETQLRFIPSEQFYERIRRAFVFLEDAVRQGRILWYGTATWEGYRKSAEAPDRLSLLKLIEIANDIGGARHHFRFIQLPFNLAMVEAYGQKAEHGGGPPKSVLEVAEEYGITAVASASLLQAKLAKGLPDELANQLGLETDAQRAIQFVRSTPGITVALVGMSQSAHVAENLALRTVDPVPLEVYKGFYRQSG
jgi:aryl-alcohol dehydrogenase-like predicted oxidoreductase